ncbi:transposase family protein [Planktothrix agardhii]|uniref:transposase family protein n=1 Tax=Planktothrix agardhii TaxID=1160 RepID=UPI0005A633FE|nr:transposase family protein [Planktothrix agardhii]
MSKLRDYLDKNPQQAKRLLGMEYEQLIKLIQAAELLEQERRQEQEKAKIRLIKAGGGRHQKLSVKEQILLTLIYLHQMPTFQMLGLQFEVSESTANDIFHNKIKILRELLPASLVEQIKKNESDWEWVEKILLEFELVVDSYEQPMQRPTDNEEQKKYYSGKKKTHTFKNQVIVMPNGKEIVDIAVGYTGATSDLKLWRERREELGNNQKYRGDKAYVGETAINTPYKKPRNQEISLEHREENRLKAKQRIVVEHLIRLIKIYRVASERFRLKSQNYEAVILTVCGLIRWRIGAIVLLSKNCPECF